MSTINLFSIKLSSGRHADPSEGMSIMQAAALYAGEPPSYHPECVCPAIAAFATVLNSALPEHSRTALLLPLLPLLVGTRPRHPRGAERQAQRRAIFLSLSVARAAVPAVLKSLSLYDHANVCAAPAISVRAKMRQVLAANQAIMTIDASVEQCRALSLSADALEFALWRHADGSAAKAANATAWAAKALWHAELAVEARSGSSPRRAAEVARDKCRVVWSAAIDALQQAALLGDPKSLTRRLAK